MKPQLTDIESWLIECALSINTTDRYRRALLRVIDTIDLETLTPTIFKNWLLSQGWSNSTQWVAYSAVRGFVRWKFGAKHPVLSLKLKRGQSPPQRWLTDDLIDNLLASFNTQTIKGIRDLALASLFLDTGLRVSEVCRLQVQYLDNQKRKFSVIVKGGRWAGGIYGAHTASYLDNWLAARSKIVHAGVSTVFIGVGGLTPGQPLTRHGLQRIVKDWGIKAGIGKMSPHDFRRTFATQAILLGCPERLLMEAGRWKTPEMIKRYTPGITADDFARYSPVTAIMSR
jgi:integrase/recombinase XerC